MMSFFSVLEGARLQEITNAFDRRYPGPRLYEETGRILDQNERIKKQIFKCLDYAIKQLEQRDVLINKIRQLLKRQKCMPLDKFDDSIEDQVQAVNRLKDKVAQLNQSSVGYYQLISSMGEMRDLDESKLPNFQKNVNNKLTYLFHEKSCILTLAQRIVLYNKESTANEDLKRSIQLITSFLRFGIASATVHQERIYHPELKQKWGKLFEKLRTQWCDLYEISSPLREFLNQLSYQYNSNKSIEQKFKILPKKMRDFFEPVYKQVVRLRKINASPQKETKTASKVGVFDRLYNPNRMKKQTTTNHKKLQEIPKYEDYLNKRIEQASVQQLVQDCAIANKKLDDVQSRMKKLEWFITQFSSINQSQTDTRKIEEALRTYREQNKQQLRVILERLKQKTKRREGSEKKEQKVEEFQFKFRKPQIEKQIILQQRIDELKEEIIQIDLKLKQARDENAELIQQLNDKDNKIQYLERQVEQHNQRNEFFQDSIKKLKKQIVEGKEYAQPKRLEQSCNHEAEITRLTSLLEQYRQKILQTNRKRSQLSTEYQALMRKMKQKEEIIAEFQKNQAQLPDKMKKTIEEKEKFISKLREQNTLLRKMAAKSSQTKNSLQQKNEEEKQKKPLLEQKPEFEQRSLDQNSQLQTLKRQCQALEIQLRKRDEQQINHSHDKLDSLQDLTHDLRRQIDDLHRKVDEKDRRIQELEKNQVQHP